MIDDRQIVSRVDACPHCGGPADHAFGEEAVGARVSWFESWGCSACGHRSEADGADRLPDELRTHVVNLFGTHSVRVLTRDRVALVRALRSFFDCSFPDARDEASRLPGLFATLLTRAEALALRRKLEQASLDARVEPE